MKSWSENRERMAREQGAKNPKPAKSHQQSPSGSQKPRWRSRQRAVVHDPRTATPKRLDSEKRGKLEVSEESIADWLADPRNLTNARSSRASAWSLAVAAWREAMSEIKDAPHFEERYAWEQRSCIDSDPFDMFGIKESAERAIQFLSDAMTLLLHFHNEHLEDRSERDDKLFLVLPPSAEERAHFAVSELETILLSSKILDSYKYLRGIGQRKNSGQGDEDIEPASNSIGDFPVINRNSFPELPDLCRNCVTKWKKGAGWNKNWKTIPSIDLLKRYNQLSSRWRRKKVTAPWAADKSNMTTLDLLIFAVAQPIHIPRNMLRKYERKMNSPGLMPPSYKPCNIARRLNIGCKDSKPCNPKTPRKRKRNSQIEIQNIICDGICSQRGLGLSDSELLKADIEEADTIVKELSSHNGLSGRAACKSVMGEETAQRASSALTVSYESYIGAIIGGRFVLRGLVDAKACYDVHTAEDLYTRVEYIAKAYTISGVKGKERDPRIKNLKRNVSKTSCVAVIDENRRKWVFFSPSLHSNVESETVSDPLSWLEEQQYRRNFPSLSPCGITRPTRQRTFLKSYASCLRSIQAETKDHFTHKKQRARDRQRRKRKEKRAAKAQMHEIIEGKDVLSEERSCGDISRSFLVSGKIGTVEQSVEEVKKEPNPPNSRELQARISTLRQTQVYSLAEDNGTTPIATAGNELPSEEAELLLRDCLPTTYTRFFPYPDLLDIDEFERYIKALERRIGTCLFDESDEELWYEELWYEGFWQWLISGPAVSFKTRFFHILEKCRTNSKLAKEAAVARERFDAKIQKERDFILISDFLHNAPLVSQHGCFHSVSFSAALRDLQRIIFSGSRRGSKAIQLLCEGSDDLVLGIETNYHDHEPVTCKAYPRTTSMS